MIRSISPSTENDYLGNKGYNVSEIQVRTALQVSTAVKAKGANRSLGALSAMRVLRLSNARAKCSSYNCSGKISLILMFIVTLLYGKIARTSGFQSNKHIVPQFKHTFITGASYRYIKALVTPGFIVVLYLFSGNIRVMITDILSSLVQWTLSGILFISTVNISRIT